MNAAAPGILILPEQEVRRLLTVELAIESQRDCFRALGSGEAVLPARLLVPGDGDSVAFCYAARLGHSAAAVSKFGSVNPGNADLGLPAVNAVVLVLDPATGLPAAMLDGTSLTEIRTAAASAVAAEALAPDARTLGVLGTGVQGRAHVRALARTHRWESVRMFGRDPGRLAEAVRALSEELGVEVTAASDARDAVAEADAVALCTTSSSPVVKASWLRPGATVISVGSFAADRHEYGADVIAAAGVVVVDDLETAAEHAGPVAQALREGTLAAGEACSLGEVLVGAAAGRTSPDQLVVYTSVGIGAQDAAAATAVVAAAAGAGVGQVVSLTG